MIYETNKCTEYAMKDSEGEKLDVKAINTAIKAVKSGSVPFYNSLNEVPTDGTLPKVFGLAAEDADGEYYICFRFGSMLFVSFQIADDCGIYSYRYDYDSEDSIWEREVFYDDVRIPTKTGTKLYKHSIMIDNSIAFQVIDVITDNPTPITDTPSGTHNVISGIMTTYGPGTNAVKSPVITNVSDYDTTISFNYFNTDFTIGRITYSKSAATDTVTPL